MKGRVLVAGFATRHVAQSAYGAGYEVYAVDHFCDQDLGWYARDARKFDELDEIAPAVDEMVTKHQPDFIVVTSGAESLQTRGPLYGTPLEKAAKFLDKLETQLYFEEKGIPAPPLLPKGHYPVMIKPRTASGGWRNRVVADREEQRKWEDEYDNPPHITQALLEGTPSSVCCLADGKRAVAVAVNEQMLRGGERFSYGFCGSITPYITPSRDQMIYYAEKIAAESGCLGTVGVDFIVGADLWAIEVNPRFQATLDTVEMSSGINLFSAHVKACIGELPGYVPPFRQYAARKILFADRAMEIRADLRKFSPLVADIPHPGAWIDEGHAVVSVYGWGPDPLQARDMLDKHFRRVRQYMSGWSHE